MRQAVLDSLAVDSPAAGQGDLQPMNYADTGKARFLHSQQPIADRAIKW